MRKRSKRLSGLPSEHKVEAKKLEQRLETGKRKVLAQIRDGECRAALSSLIVQAAAAGGALVHGEGAERPYGVRNMVDWVGDAEVYFQQNCLRKPGLLDRFRKKRS